MIHFTVLLHPFVKSIILVTSPYCYEETSRPYHLDYNVPFCCEPLLILQLVTFRLQVVRKSKAFKCPYVSKIGLKLLFCDFFITAFRVHCLCFADSIV